MHRYLLLAVLMSLNAGAQQPTLKQAYDGCFLVGVALKPAEFTGADAKAAALVEQQFNSVSPENVLKWERIHPQPNTYEFDPADEYVQFGQQNHMFIVGHTLIWHSQTPKWVFQDSEGNPVSRKVLLKRMRDHIKTVVGRYKGRVNGWDVINEVLDEDGRLRQSPWLKIIGPDYIEKAFEYAHKADPKAELYYNDYNLENTTKLQGALRLVAELKAKKVPITGVGIQGHMLMDWPTPAEVDNAITTLGKAGVKVMITELDVDELPFPNSNNTADVSYRSAANPKLNPYPNGLPDAIQQQFTQLYADLFHVYGKHCGTLSRVTFWGVSDKGSWKNDWPIRGRTTYPLLFDRNLAPKPAFAAVIEASPNKHP